MKAFADTSGLVALAAPRDSRHALAAAWFRDSGARDGLVTSDYVLDETVTRLRRVAGHAAAVAVGHAIRSSTVARLVKLQPADLEAAWEIFMRYDDRDLSFTDCTSVALVRRLGLKSVFGFDDDFAGLGIQLVPRV